MIVRRWATRPPTRCQCGIGRVLAIVVLAFSMSGCTVRSSGLSEIRGLEQRVSRLEADQAGRVETQAAQPLATLSQTIVQQVAKSKYSVVEVIADPSVVTNSGTGFIYNDAGVILTNDHLVRVTVRKPDGEIKTYYKDNITVRLFDGRTVKGRLIGIDPDTDLAAIKIDIENLPDPLQFSSRRLQQGELTYSIGHPRGLSYSVEWRPVSATYRKGSLKGSLLHQIDRGFFVGNSGGPVLDLQGKVVGMVYSTLNFKDKTNPKRTVVYSAIGWVIPSETLLAIAPELINGKHKITGFIKN